MIFDFEDGKNVKYDLSNGQVIGKLGKPVKDLCSQLRGYSMLEIFDSCEDKNYGLFLNFVYQRFNNSIWNIGTVLKRAKQFSKFEQIFACGIINVDGHFTIKLDNVPKGLIKLVKRYNLRLSDNLVIRYKSNPNIFNVVLDMDFNSLSTENVCNLLLEGRSYDNSSKTIIQTLIDEFKYNFKSLFTYFDNLMTYEALENPTPMLHEFKDYVQMMSKISPKFEKYPRNFLTTHRIACRNYNRLKEKFVEEDFQNRIDKSLEQSYGEYKFIYPMSTQDIKDEAVQQNNCVASYIQRVIDGQCHILFLRRKDALGQSLITIEVRNKKVVQAKGKFNRDVTLEEQLIIDKYNKNIGKLDIAC